jgi:NAD(P)-dependent dehydrogenase (short-subunit alcohol dehydrogenase family)
MLPWLQKQLEGVAVSDRQKSQVEKEGAMPKYELEGKVAAVTGAGRGIGRAIARRLAREGAIVVVTDIDEANAAQVAGEIQADGGQAVALKVDVTCVSEVEQMVREAVGHSSIPAKRRGMP